tara:strand:- start:2059 stop:2262 length:204 start_codon:yes stop_codon:yes gene_type:complete
MILSQFYVINFRNHNLFVRISPQGKNGTGAMIGMRITGFLNDVIKQGFTGPFKKGAQQFSFFSGKGI